MRSLNQQKLRSRLAKVCVAITGDTAEEMVERAAAVLPGSSFLEFRLDSLSQPVSALPAIRALLAKHPNLTAIATCRRRANGGRFDGSLADELHILGEAGGAGFHIADVELESAEEGGAEALEPLRRSGLALLVSYHDFSATGDLQAIYARIARFQPEFAKIVPTARALTDNLRLIQLLEHVGTEAEVVGLCMGNAGVLSRVLGVRAGGAFTFAAAAVGSETAPGQMDARTLNEVYRIDQIDAATRVYGVAGDPVRHSLSPLMLNTAFHRDTINAVYLPLETAAIDDLLELVRQTPIHGLSITMPHKRTILPYLERTDPLTTRIGACNTVLRAADGKLYGFNTDVAGITGPLEKRMGLRGSRILVLGAGGAARAAVFGLREKGAEVHILNRTPATALALAKEAGASVLPRERLRNEHFDAIVNATPAGMHSVSAESPLSAEELRTSLVFDLVYRPIETPLLRLARQRGIATVPGVEMFVQQGARQFEIWTGRPAPDEEMLRVVLHALRQPDLPSSREPVSDASGVETQAGPGASRDSAPKGKKLPATKAQSAKAKKTARQRSAKSLSPG